jgi:succinate dehydrogenase flavin-adding protein (antitoxin of CptAB toxin-antitoxin module)
LRENFLEQCYMSNLSEQDVKIYDELLKKRTKDLEGVIDGHFEFIKAAIVDEAEERRDRDIERTFAKEDYRQKID